MNNKTIDSISVSWNERFDGYILPLIGASGVYQNDWIDPSSPPRGEPRTGFNIRSQSRPEEGTIYLDFDNIPFFWKQENNPKAIPWPRQHQAILKTLRYLGLPIKPTDFATATTRPTELEIPLDQLLEFVSEFS